MNECGEWVWYPAACVHVITSFCVMQVPGFSMAATSMMDPSRMDPSRMDPSLPLGMWRICDAVVVHRFRFVRCAHML